MRPRCSRSAAGRLSDARSRPTPLHRNPPPTPHPPSPALSPSCGRLTRSPRASRPRPRQATSSTGAAPSSRGPTRPAAPATCARCPSCGARKSQSSPPRQSSTPSWRRRGSSSTAATPPSVPRGRRSTAASTRCPCARGSRSRRGARTTRCARCSTSTSSSARRRPTPSASTGSRSHAPPPPRPPGTAHRHASGCARTQARARNLQRHRPHARPLARTALDPEQVLEQVLERRDGLRRRRRLVVAAVFAAPLPRAAEQAGRPRAAAPLRRGEGLLSRAWLVRGESDLPLACDQERVLSRAYRACFSSARVVGDKALAIQGIKTARKDDEQAAITAAGKQWVQRGATPALRELSARCRCSRAALELQPLFSARQPVAPQPGSRGIISCTAPPILASTLAMVKRLQRAGNRLPLELWRVCRRGRARSVESEQARLNR